MPDLLAVPSAQQGPAQRHPKGQGSCSAALCGSAALSATQELLWACVCNPSAAFHSSRRNRAQLKGISRSNFQAGTDLIQRYPFHGLGHTSLWLLESLIQRKLSMTQSRPRELQGLSPFAHVWIIKSFLKLLVPHCLTVINLSSLIWKLKVFFTRFQRTRSIAMKCLMKNS